MLVKVYFPTDLCDILYASKPENNPDHRLRDASGQLMIMKQYEITDAASYAAAVKMVNTKFYELRSKRKDNYDLSIVLSARITAYEDCKKYQRYYRSWEKKPTQKHSALEKQYEFELQMPRGGGNIAALAESAEISEHRTYGVGYRSARNEGGCVQTGGGEAGVYQGK